MYGHAQALQTLELQRRVQATRSKKKTHFPQKDDKHTLLQVYSPTIIQFQEF